MVTGESLAEFLAPLALRVIDPERCWLEMKFGERIDSDRKLSTWMEWDESRTVGSAAHIAWDVEANGPLATIVERLRQEVRPLYRATFSATVSDPVYQALSRLQPYGNSVLRMDRFHMELGPVTLTWEEEKPEAKTRTAGEGKWIDIQDIICRSWLVGWLQVGISGQGHLHPWSKEDLLQKFRESRELQWLIQHCRETWPVGGAPPDQRTVALREVLAHLWCGEDFSAVDEWRWTLDCDETEATLLPPFPNLDLLQRDDVWTDPA